MSENQQLSKPINVAEEKTIRIMIDTGRGFGHQNAAVTLMQNLRNKGFRGNFDVYYEESFQDDNRKKITGKGVFGKILEKLITGFESVELQKHDNGQNIVHPILGVVKIQRIPDDMDISNQLINAAPMVNLTISAGHDLRPDQGREYRIKNSKAFIQLQPTDWDVSSCFILDANIYRVHNYKNHDMRLSSLESQHLKPIELQNLRDNEKNLLELLNNQSVNRQLVYGVYEEGFHMEEINGKWIQIPDNLKEQVLLSKIIEANLEALKSDKERKQTVLLLPQDLKDHYKNIDADLQKDIQYVDLTVGGKPEIDPNKKIIVVYTGTLSKPLFEYTAITGTNLPVCCEGCNTRELCEYHSKPFVFMNSNNEELRRYDVKNKNSQELQYFASKHLKTESATEVGVDPLREYIEQVRNNNPQIMEYHQQRREEFQKRPDAVEFMLNELNKQIEKENAKDESKTTAEFKHTDKFSRSNSFSSDLKSGRQIDSNSDTRIL